MAGYKLATYQSTEGPRAGLVVGDKVFDAAKLTKRAAYATVLGILEDWRTARGLLEKAAAAKARQGGEPAAQPHQAPGARAAGLRRSFVRVRTTPITRPR